MEIGNGLIKQLVKTEEFANGEIDLTIDTKINIWCSEVLKIDNIFALILNMLKEQRLIADGIEEHSLLRPKEFDKSKIILFAKNKEYFEKLNLPKELMMGERVLSNNDEELLNYLLETVLDNSRTAYDKTLSIFDKLANNSNIKDDLKNQLALFYNDYNAHYKKPYIFIMIEDVSMFKNDRTIELLKRVFELGRSKSIVCCFGSIIDNNIEFLSQFANANITLVDKMKNSDLEAWYNINYFGLGDLTKLNKMSDNDYLCIKGNLYDQGRDFGIKPYILTIREYKKERSLIKPDEKNSSLRKVDIYNDDFSALKTFPSELAEYKYNLQEATIKYMVNYSDLKRIIVKDIKSVVIDYLEFETVESYDILMFLNENFIKLKNEFNYRMGEYIKIEKFRARHLRIERCFSLSRNMEISEYIKLRQDDGKIQYDWQINVIILARCIKDLWNLLNEENKINSFHFFKYPKEYRKKYGYNEEWSSDDLI